MVVYEDTDPPSGDGDDYDVTQYIIDAAVDRMDDSGDIEDAIKAALKALKIDFKFLVTWTSAASVIEYLGNSDCVVENERVSLYLDNCEGGPGPGQIKNIHT